jgi:alanine racemase
MRPTKAYVDLDALRHNLGVAQHLAPGSKNVAVIKANAYGHGMLEAARALGSLAQALAVATIDEAVSLRDAGVGGPLIVLQGAPCRSGVEEAAARGLWLMIHTGGQLEQLLGARVTEPLGAWIKVDTGMHRIGMTVEEATTAIEAIERSDKVNHPPVLCTHLACADEVDNPMTAEQVDRFRTFSDHYDLPLSIANSAGIMHWPASHGDWNRPGIMLYGADPAGTFGDTCLRPVMRLVSEIMAVRTLAPGEGVGYGQRWKARVPSRIGTVSIGYGDGYPRHAGNGTPVWVKDRRVPLVGTVSMDMITVDLTGHDDIAAGDPVELWGPNIPVNEVAEFAGTIGYELLAGMTSRPPRVYSSER